MPKSPRDDGDPSGEPVRGSLVQRTPFRFMGRLPTDAQIARIMDAVESGLDSTVAASLGGVHRTLLRTWLEHGRHALDREADGHELNERDRALADLAYRYDHASAKHERALSDRAHLATLPWVDKDGNERPGDGKLALEILARRHPKRWSPQLRVQLDGEVDHILEQLEKVLPREHYLTALEAIAGGAAQGDLQASPSESRRLHD